jgi:hypothetical protein
MHDNQRERNRLLFFRRADDFSSVEGETWRCPWCGGPTWTGEQPNPGNGYTALMAHCEDRACVNYGKTYTYALRYDDGLTRRIALRHRDDGFVDYLPHRAGGDPAA